MQAIWKPVVWIYPGLNDQKLQPWLPMNQKEEEEMNKFIDNNLKKGFICKSTSPEASPFFFIAKKGQPGTQTLSGLQVSE